MIFPSKKQSSYLVLSIASIALVFFSMHWWKNHHNIQVPSIELSLVSSLKNIIPVAIIGSGPAGLSAALYTSRMDLHTVVFKGEMPGGQLMGTSYIENWPGVGSTPGPNVMKACEKQAEWFGAQLSSETIDRVDFSTWPYRLWADEGTQVHALTVIIATGSLPMKLGVEGEETYWGRGVSTCAVCDAPFYKDRPVAVVGGGDSAVEAALQLARQGAKSVTLLVRSGAMRASKIMQDRLHEYPTISIHFHTKVTHIYGNSSHVTHIEIIDGSKKTSQLTVDALFLSIGHIPNSSVFKKDLACSAEGYILRKAYCQETSRPGIFVAGDVSDSRYRQAGVAAGDGIKAALEAIEFLRNHNFTQTLDRKIQSQYYEVRDTHETSSITPIMTLADYHRHVDQKKGLVVIDFYAPYCPGCMHMLPVVNSVATQLQDRVIFLKVDTSIAPQLAKQFDVVMVPTLLVFKDGKILSRSTELMNKRQLSRYIHQFIN